MESTIRTAIKNAIEGDDEIFKYCDPNYAESTVEKLVKSIHEKILEYPKDYKDCFFSGFEIDKEVVGYIFCIKRPNLLVSFGLNKKYRTPIILKNMFDEIKNVFDNGHFESYMWERNERAIKWLEKCGMVKDECKLPKVVKLKI